MSLDTDSDDLDEFIQLQEGARKLLIVLDKIWLKTKNKYKGRELIEKWNSVFDREFPKLIQLSCQKHGYSPDQLYDALIDVL